MKKENSISRRSFLKSSAMAGALGAIGTGSAASVVLTSCGGGEKAAAFVKEKQPEGGNIHGNGSGNRAASEGTVGACRTGRTTKGTGSV